MKKELQDKAWAALPKEFKEKVKKYYMECIEEQNLSTSRYYEKLHYHIGLLIVLFGEHNLTSDTDEATNVASKTNPKFKVGDLVTVHLSGGGNLTGNIYEVIADGSYDVRITDGSMMHSVKCERISPYIKKKFLIGDKVLISNDSHIVKDFRGCIGTVESINSENQCTVYVNNRISSCFNTAFLTPLSELKFKEGNKVIIIKGGLKGKCGIVTDVVGSKENLCATIDVPGHGTYTINFNELELYTEPQLDNIIPESRDIKDSQLYITVASKLLCGIFSNPVSINTPFYNKYNVLKEIYNITDNIIEHYGKR